MPAYFSEIDMEGGTNSNFIEIAVPAGTNTSAYSIAVYDEFGAFLRTYDLGSVVTTQFGTDVYLIDDNDPSFDDIGNDEALALIDDTGTVLQFLSFDQTTVAIGGPADGITSTPIGIHGGATSSLQTTDGGSTYTVNSTKDPGSIPCYAPGTLIDTPDGSRAVETLRPGDFVLTTNHGPQPIRWVRSSAKITWIHFACDRHEVVVANGCLSESLLLGPIVVNGLTRTERSTLTDIFGPVTEPGAAFNGYAALACLKVGEVRLQIVCGATAKHSAAAKEIRKWDIDSAMERYEAERLHDAILANRTRQATAA